MARPARGYGRRAPAIGASCAVVVACALLGSCGPRTPPAPVTIRSLRGPPLLIDPGGLPERRVIARARTRALATDVDNVYFGDRDELYSAPKRGGERRRIGERSPLAIAVAERIFWIAEPGDTLRATRPGEPGEVLVRTTGVLTDLVSDGRDVFVADTVRSAGVVLRVVGSTTARIGTVDVAPLALGTDAADAYVLSEHAIHAVPRRPGGAPRVVFEGEALSGLQVSGGYVFTTATIGSSRALVRIPSAGGGAFVLERAVRDGPFAVFAAEVFFFDADQPALRRVSVQGGASAVVARAPELANANELVVDASGIYIATEDDRGGVVLGLPRPP